MGSNWKNIFGGWTIPIYIVGAVIAWMSGIVNDVISGIFSTLSSTLSTIAENGSQLILHATMAAMVLIVVGALIGAILLLVPHDRADHHGKRLLKRSVPALIICAAILAGGAGTITALVQGGMIKVASKVPASYMNGVPTALKEPGK
jgi:nitrogen fixation/metabolism regulation signal transduction histidine kinase